MARQHYIDTKQTQVSACLLTAPFLFTPDGIGRFIQQFRDVLCEIRVQPFDLLTPVKDPLERFTDDEIEEIQSTMVIGYGRPPVPRFGDGPRLQRLEQRVEAIWRGHSDEKHLLPVLEQVRSELRDRRDYLAKLNADARNGIGGREPVRSARTLARPKGVRGDTAHTLMLLPRLRPTCRRRCRKSAPVAGPAQGNSSPQHREPSNEAGSRIV